LPVFYNSNALTGTLVNTTNFSAVSWQEQVTTSLYATTTKLIWSGEVEAIVHDLLLHYMHSRPSHVQTCCNLFLPWYSWKVRSVHLALNNNHSLSHKYTWNTANLIFKKKLINQSTEVDDLLLHYMHSRPSHVLPIDRKKCQWVHWSYKRQAIYQFHYKRLSYKVTTI
jgi:hypothetical protein